MHLAYACLGVFCYSFFLIHDTQMIVGGKHRRFQFDKDSYILAAISLYLDIINLFLYIIQILNEESWNRIAELWSQVLFKKCRRE